MAIPGIDYNLLLSTARRVKDIELLTVLEAAKKGQTQGFESKPNLVAKALRYLIKDRFFNNHPNVAQTVRLLSPVAKRSPLWNWEAWRDRSSDNPNVDGLSFNEIRTRIERRQLEGEATNPFQQPRNPTPPLTLMEEENIMLRRFLGDRGRHRGDLEANRIRVQERIGLWKSSIRLCTKYIRTGIGGNEFRKMLRTHLVYRLQRHPSDDEILFHLTEKGERSLLPEIAKMFEVKPEELQQVAERLVTEGILRPTETRETERAREAKENEGPKPRGTVK